MSPHRSNDPYYLEHFKIGLATCKKKLEQDPDADTTMDMRHLGMLIRSISKEGRADALKLYKEAFPEAELL